MRFALDRRMTSTVDRDGRLHVASVRISKAAVNGYRGREIPGWQELELDPDKVYDLLRPPEELENAAKTFNGIQFLTRHVPVNAEDHKPYDVIGTTGTDAVFEDPYLKNSMTVWSSEAIADIEAEVRKELSSAYHYRPKMTPGIWRGKHFDGRIIDIVGNHVALVKDGRVGADCAFDARQTQAQLAAEIAAIVPGFARIERSWY